MRRWLSELCLFFLFICRCGGEADQNQYLVRVVFPDQETYTQCRSLQLSVMEPGPEANCAALLESSAKPGDPQYQLLDEVGIPLPIAQEIQPLSNIGDGKKLFYAEAKGSDQKILLLGCTSSEGGPEGPAEIKIELQKFYTCDLPPSPYFRVDCSDEPTSVNKIVSCNISTGGVSSQEGCIQCKPYLVPESISQVYFSGNTPFRECDFDGWELKTSGCNSALSYLPCPLQIGQYTSSCCADEYCLASLQKSAQEQVRMALQADSSRCNYHQWMLTRKFDFRAFETVEICFDEGQTDSQNTYIYNMLQLQLEKTGLPSEVLSCNDSKGLNTTRHECKNILQDSFENAESTLTFWLYSPYTSSGGLGKMWLDNIQVTGGYQDCLPKTKSIFLESFDECTDKLTNGWHGWSITGSPACLSSVCPGKSVGALGSDNESKEWAMDTSLNTSELFGQVLLCWNQSSQGSLATLNILMDTGSGFHPVLQDNFMAYFYQSCEPRCINLSAASPAAANNPNLRLRFEVQSQSGSAILDDIQVVGYQRCDVTDSFTFGQMEAGETSDYFFEVQNKDNRAVRLHLECTWSDSKSSITATDSLTYVK